MGKGGNKAYCSEPKWQPEGHRSHWQDVSKVTVMSQGVGKCGGQGWSNRKVGDDLDLPGNKTVREGHCHLGLFLKICPLMCMAHILYPAERPAAHCWNGFKYVFPRDPHRQNIQSKATTAPQLSRRLTRSQCLHYTPMCYLFSLISVFTVFHQFSFLSTLGNKKTDQLLSHSSVSWCERSPNPATFLRL